MKRFILALILALCCTPSSGFCTTKAQQVEFLLAQVRNTSGPLSGGKVYFYAAGTTTPKTIWLDRDKSTAAANPYTLDSNGTAQIYAEGLYKVVIKTAGGTTVYSRDNLAFVAFSDVDATNAQTLAGYFPDTGTTGSTIPVRDANGKLPGDILGDSATLGGYGPATTATASKVAVRDGSGKLAGDVLGNAATATLAANSSLVGGFAASQTPTAGNVTVLNGSNQLYLSGTGAISVPRDAGGYMVRTSTSASKSGLRRDVNDKLILGDDVDNNNVYTNSLYKFWHSGNDGTLSGLDADTVDGSHASDFAALTEFTKSLGPNGYQKLPGGLIIQWGQEGSYHDIPGISNVAMTFPINFPTACLTVITGAISNGTYGSFATHAKSLTTTGFNLIFDEWAANTQSVIGTYIAIGY